MATNLETLVEPLKRELAVPGEFATYFPNTTDDDLVGCLADSFSEAQLDGFFSASTIDLNTFDVTPDLSGAGGALIVIYGGIRTLRSKIRNTKTTTRYEAGGAVYDVQQSALVLKQELESFENRKRQLLLDSRMQRLALVGSTYVLDGYLVRANGYLNELGLGEYGGFYLSELAGYGGV